MLDFKFQKLLGVALLLIVLVTCDSSLNEDSELLFGKKCKELLMQYALLTANFTQCFIQNARPIMVCQSCIEDFIAVSDSHTNITKLKDEAGAECRLELINVDRLQVIEGSFRYVTEQWKLASCHKCFDRNETSLNSNSKEILVLHEKMDKCIKEHGSSNESVCTDCAEDYQCLNDFYDNHESYNGFCMDIVDMMNSTRIKWSSFNCCSDRRKPDLFLQYNLLFLPVIFYLGMWCSSSTALRDFINSYLRRTVRV